MKQALVYLNDILAAKLIEDDRRGCEFNFASHRQTVNRGIVPCQKIQCPTTCQRRHTRQSGKP